MENIILAVIVSLILFGPLVYIAIIRHRWINDPERMENTWKRNSELMWCSINALKYWFHNVHGNSYIRGTFQWKKSIILIGIISSWFTKDTEIKNIFESSRYRMQESIVITENHSLSRRNIHRVVYYITNVLWIVSIVLLLLTNWISILCMIPVAIIAEQSSKYMNLLHALKQQSMESLWFEKSFDAFSRDPIEARMIITPAFMDRLEEFSEKWNLKWKIRIIWEKDSFTLLLKWDIEKYGKESDGSYTLVKSMEEILNLSYYSIP